MPVDCHEKVTVWYLKVFAMQFFLKQEKKNQWEKKFVYWCKQSQFQNHATSKYRFQLYIVVGKEVELSQFVDEWWHFVFYVLFFPISQT